MKKIIYIIGFLISFSAFSQTPFPSGARFPNATKSDTLSTKTRIPIMQANSGNLINKYIPLDSISNYLTVPVINHANSHQIGGADEISGENLAVTVTPSTTGYTPTDSSLEGHLKGIDSTLVALASGAFTPATPTEINTGTDNTKMVTPLGLAGSDYFTKTQNDTYYKPIGYVPAWADITGKPTTTSYFTNNGADNTSTYVEHDEISGLVLEPPFLKELVPDTYLPSTTGNFILRGSYFTPSMSVVVEGHTINYKTFISSNEVIVNLTTSATEGLYDVTLNNGISVTYNDQLQVVNGTVFQPTSNDWENIINNLDVSNVGNPKFTVINSVSSGQWKQIIDYTKDFKIQFKLSKSPLGFNISGEEPFLYLKSSIDNSSIFTLFLRKDASTIINFRVSSETDIIDYANTLVGSGLNTIEQNFDLVSENSIEFRYISGIMYFYYNNVLKRTFTHVLAENLNLAVALRWWDLTDIKYIDLSDASGGYTDYSKLISQFENDANYLQDAPSNGNEYVRKDGDWQVATGGGSGHTIQNNGIALATQPNLNFKGSGVIVENNAGNSSIDVTIPRLTKLDESSPIDVVVWGGTQAQFDSQFPSGAPANYLSIIPDAAAPELTAADITDFDTEVANNSAVAANTAKISASASATNQGNTFNGANQLVQLDGTGKLPAIDGSALTNLPSSGGGLDKTIDLYLDNTTAISPKNGVKWTFGGNPYRFDISSLNGNAYLTGSYNGIVKSLLFSTTGFRPDVTNDQDLGTNTVRFKSGYFSNLVYGSGFNAGGTSAGKLTADGGIDTTTYLTAPSYSYSGTSVTGTISHANGTVAFGGGGTLTYTIPLNATVAYPLGTRIMIVFETGGGNVTVVATAGITLYGGTPAAMTIGKACWIVKSATDAWTVININ